MLVLLFIVYYHSLYQPFYFTNQSSEQLFYGSGMDRIMRSNKFGNNSSVFNMLILKVNFQEKNIVLIFFPLFASKHLGPILLWKMRNTYFLGHSFKLMVFMG